MVVVSSDPLNPVMDIAIDPMIDFKAIDVPRMKETELGLKLLMRNTKPMEC